MARGSAMRFLARWHIRLGWLVALPLLIWTISGLVMVARPIEEVRGTTLRITAAPPPALPALPGIATPYLARAGGASGHARATGIAIHPEPGRAVAVVTYADETTARFDAATGAPLPLLTAAQVRAIIGRGVAGGGQITALHLYSAGEAPFDYRQPKAVWQAVLAGDTRVYVDPYTGTIEAVRTRWWRFYDLMWGLHIMDPSLRENTHHPLLIASSILAVIGTIMGAVLLFRRRKPRIKA